MAFKLLDRTVLTSMSVLTIFAVLLQIAKTPLGHSNVPAKVGLLEMELHVQMQMNALQAMNATPKLFASTG